MEVAEQEDVFCAWGDTRLIAPALSMAYERNNLPDVLQINKQDGLIKGGADDQQGLLTTS